MKRNITLLLFMFMALKCWSQNCKTEYTSIKGYSFSLDLNQMKDIIAHITDHIKRIDQRTNSSQDCKIDVGKWKIVIKKWNEFKTSYADFLKIYPTNNADRRRIKTQWNNFQDLLVNYEDQVFIITDNTLYKAIKEAETNIQKSITGVNTNIQDIQTTSNYIKTTSEDIKTKSIAIETTINKIDNTINKDIVPGQTAIKNELNKVKDILLNRDTTFKNSLNLLAFDNNVYGLGYAQVFEGQKTTKYNAFAMMIDVVVPADNFRFQSTGLFISGGMQHRSMILLAGLGYLDNLNTQNFSWKGTILYFPSGSGVGFGAAYSPLTKAGISLNFRLQ